MYAHTYTYMQISWTFDFLKFSSLNGPTFHNARSSCYLEVLKVVFMHMEYWNYLVVISCIVKVLCKGLLFSWVVYWECLLFLIVYWVATCCWVLFFLQLSSIMVCTGKWLSCVRIYYVTCGFFCCIGWYFVSGYVQLCNVV